MLAVPVSLIGAFFIMYIADFSVNVLTLLGIVLAIGLVVDDAIVVLENVFKKVESGMAPREAGVRGSAEVYFAIIATTIALVAVFMPVIFLQGITGRLFKEFGIVLSGSVIISAFVALTLTPMMASRILKQHQHHSAFYQKAEPFFSSMTEWYRAKLAVFLDRRWLAFAVIGAAFAFILVIGASLQSELAPLEDRSRMRISATGPEGATFEYMDVYMRGLEQEIKRTVPEREAMVVITSGGGGGGVNSGFANLMLVPPEKRERSQQEIADQLSTMVRRMTGARTFLKTRRSVGEPVDSCPVRPARAELRQAERGGSPLSEEAQKRPEFQIVDVNLKFNKPEVRVEINRDRAMALGVSASDIGQTVQATLAASASITLS